MRFGISVLAPWSMKFASVKLKLPSITFSVVPHSRAMLARLQSVALSGSYKNQ
jgi:hypothetical protein